MAAWNSLAQRPVAPSPPEYVEARVCARCHQQIAASYAKTGMGRSFFRPELSNMIEGFTGANFHHDLSDTHFSMVSRGGEYFQRRWQIGYGGGEINVEEKRIDYVMGSGNHARSYLHQTPRGTLLELPLGWYPDSPLSWNGHWGMSPGSDNAHPRTRRFISYKCMFCHNGIPQIPRANETPDSEPVFTGELPRGIDCQRCHGPGGRHVRVVQTRGSARQDVLASIVNPDRLSSKLRMEVCMQCHLETSSGRIPAALVRFDRGPFSYRPGEPLDAFMLTFDHAPGTGHDDKFEAVNSVYRLRQSQCFLKSAGNLTCETCHNPHRAPRGAEAIAHYDGVCLKCHAQLPGRHTSAPDCASCHMPKRRAEDTPGMVMTDHLIQRRPPPGDPLAHFRERPAAEYHGEVVPYYPSPLPRTPLNALYAGVAQVGLGNNIQAGLPLLAREMERQKPQDAEFYIVLGDGWTSVHKYPEAIAAYEQAVRLSPRSAGALRSLAATLATAGQPARASETLARAVQIAPLDAVTWYRYGMLDFTAGRLPQALEKVRKAIVLDADLPDQSRSLAEILLAMGQSDKAASPLQEALRIDPYDDAAWNLQARLLTEKGDMPRAVDAFEKAIRLRPGDASHLYDYALALVRMDRFDEAQTRVETALVSKPDLAEAHELRGGLFERKGQLAEAAAEYQRTLALRPQLTRAHLRLGTVLAAQGDMPKALEHLRIAAASNDAALAQQAKQAIAKAGAR